jgi:hypothetical protein
LYNAVKDAEYSSEDYRYGYAKGGGVKKFPIAISICSC